MATPVQSGEMDILWKPFKEKALDPRERKAAIVRSIIGLIISFFFAWSMRDAFAPPNNFLSGVGISAATVFCFFIARSALTSIAMLVACSLHKPANSEPWTWIDIGKGLIPLS